jgi:hypothetical protein
VALSLQEVEEKLKGAWCRWCHSTDVAFLLQCDLGTVECSQVVRCRECGYLFELELREFQFAP